MIATDLFLAQAVKEDWYFQMYYDDLPVWGFIGKMEKIIHHGTSELRYYLFTHIEFDVKYNEDKVIEINVSTNPEQAVDISNDAPDLKVKFTYSVRWIPTAKKWESRLDRYERFPLNPVHLEASRDSLACHCIVITGTCESLDLQIHVAAKLLFRFRSTGSPSSTHVLLFFCLPDSWPPF